MVQQATPSKVRSASTQDMYEVLKTRNVRRARKHRDRHRQRHRHRRRQSDVKSMLSSGLLDALKMDDG